MTTLLPPRFGSPSERLIRTVGRARSPNKVLGVEHEFGVFEGDQQIDFRELIHQLPIDGLALHPTNRHMYFTKRGGAIIADGIVAEIATPPIDLTHGSCTALSSWAEEARLELLALVPDRFELRGGSTHISIATESSLNDRIALFLSRTFASPLMLLMDQANSPGMLVRPRPGAS